MTQPREEAFRKAIEALVNCQRFMAAKAPKNFRLMKPFKESVEALIALRSLEGQEKCERCGGKGEIVRPGTPMGEILNVDDWIDCPTCSGSGLKPKATREGWLTREQIKEWRERLEKRIQQSSPGDFSAAVQRAKDELKAEAFSLCDMALSALGDQP